ncbi:MAG TPA: HNH endonuclease signature motif containing protein [Hyphomicrobiaceae bacterium]|jgi:hypothetical protein|nr:HNH endonuclease signature motif containing protein [Hyphomicrobiaceae bacterium]
MTTDALDAAIAQHFSKDARAAYEWQLKYNAYIASEAWQHKRLQKLLSLVGVMAHSYETMDWLVQQASRHLYCCETCGARGSHADVQVIHRHYRNLGNEAPHDLVVLCGFCHQALHKVVRSTGFPMEVVTGHLLGPRREPMDGKMSAAAFANHPPTRTTL